MPTGDYHGRKRLLSSMALFVLLCYSVVPSASAASMWSQTYQEIGLGEVRSLVATSDGGYAIAGNHALAKTDELGNIQWNKTYNPNWEVLSLVATSDGGYALGGDSGYSSRPPISHAWLAKTDALGNMKWNKTHDFQLNRG